MSLTLVLYVAMNTTIIPLSDAEGPSVAAALERGLMTAPTIDLRLRFLKALLVYCDICGKKSYGYDLYDHEDEWDGYVATIRAILNRVLTHISEEEADGKGCLTSYLLSWMTKSKNCMRIMSHRIFQERDGLARTLLVMSFAALDDGSSSSNGGGKKVDKETIKAALAFVVVALNRGRPVDVMDFALAPANFDYDLVDMVLSVSGHTVSSLLVLLCTHQVVMSGWVRETFINVISRIGEFQPQLLRKIVKEGMGQELAIMWCNEPISSVALERSLHPMIADELTRCPKHEGFTLNIYHAIDMLGQEEDYVVWILKQLFHPSRWNNLWENIASDTDTLSEYIESNEIMLSFLLRFEECERFGEFGNNKNLLYKEGTGWGLSDHVKDRMIMLDLAHPLVFKSSHMLKYIVTRIWGTPERSVVVAVLALGKDDDDDDDDVVILVAWLYSRLSFL